MEGGQEHIHDAEKSAEFARALGLSVGGHHPFVGDWLVKGLYAYRSGKYKGQAYFGTGGSESDRLKDTYNSIKPEESHQKYRPWNRDDPKIPEDIRQKLIRLEDRMNLTRQPSKKPLSRDMTRGEKILVSKHSLPIYNGIYTIQADEINGRPWFKNNSGCILYFYNANSGGGPSWSLDDRSQDGTNDWFRGGWIEPPNSGGPPLGTRRWEEAGSHRRFEIKMEYVSIPDEDSRDVTPLKTGWYRMEHADGSLIERVRVHRDEWKTSATNEFIATGDLTGDVTWYVEGNTVKVPKFGSTGKIQADGNITWGRDDNKAIYEGQAPIKQQESIEILEAVTGKPVRFKLNSPPNHNDAWVGIYPPNASDREHGKQGTRWHWIRDIDVNNASLPAQSEGNWSIRVFSDGGFTLHYREDFEIESISFGEQLKIKQEIQKKKEEMSEKIKEKMDEVEEKIPEEIKETESFQEMKSKVENTVESLGEKANQAIEEVIVESSEQMEQVHEKILISSEDSLSKLNDILERLEKALMTKDRENIISELSGSQMNLNLTVDRIENTIGYGIDEVLRGGKTIVGNVEGIPHQVSIKFPESMNDFVSGLKKGQSIEHKVTISGFNSMRKMLEFILK